MASGTAEWLSPGDLEKDLWYYSEIADDKDSAQEPPSASIEQWKKQLSSDQNASIFVTPYDNDEEEVIFLSSGRGRGGLSKQYKPGLPVRDQCRMEDSFIERKLREVSGLGYSNEIIENSIRARNNVSNNNMEFMDADTDPYEVSSSTSSSSRTTPRKTSSSLNRERSLPTSPRIPTPLQDFPPLVTSPVTAPKETKPDNPLPLSVILDRAKKKNSRKEAAQPPAAQPKNEAKKILPEPRSSVSIVCSPPVVDEPVEKITNDFWWGHTTASSSNSSEDSSWRSGPRVSPRGFEGNHWKMDSSKKNNGFNIKSPNDFPEL